MHESILFLAESTEANSTGWAFSPATAENNAEVELGACLLTLWPSNTVQQCKEQPRIEITYRQNASASLECLASEIPYRGQPIQTNQY